MKNFYDLFGANEELTALEAWERYLKLEGDMYYCIRAAKALISASEYDPDSEYVLNIYNNPQLFKAACCKLSHMSSKKAIALMAVVASGTFVQEGCVRFRMPSTEACFKNIKYSKRVLYKGAKFYLFCRDEEGATTFGNI